MDVNTLSVRYPHLAKVNLSKLVHPWASLLTPSSVIPTNPSKLSSWREVISEIWPNPSSRIPKQFFNPRILNGSLLDRRRLERKRSFIDFFLLLLYTFYSILDSDFLLGKMSDSFIINIGTIVQFQLIQILQFGNTFQPSVGNSRYIFQHQRIDGSGQLNQSGIGNISTSSQYEDSQFLAFLGEGEKGSIC